VVVRAFGLSDPGPVRKNNEDSFVTDESLGLFAVADGMGGHSAGEVASRLAIEAIEGFVRRTGEDTEFSWPYGVDPTLSYDGNRVRTAISLANRRVFRAAENHDDYTGMGTTVVCVLLSGKRLVVGHVGDSRLYLMADGALMRMTTDDSWAATILAQEGGNAAELAKHPMRNVLTNVLGAREQIDIHMLERDLAGGEKFLLCTDGLHNAVDDDTLRALMANGFGEQELAQALVKEAIGRGGRDNVTALVVSCDGAADGQ
jgi:serine/threonine protein phosphatase PrpC